MNNVGDGMNRRIRQIQDCEDQARQTATMVRRQTPEVRPGDVYAFLPGSVSSILYVVVLEADSRLGRCRVVAADDFLMAREETDLIIEELQPDTGGITARGDLVDEVPYAELKPGKRVGWLSVEHQESLRLRMQSVPGSGNGWLGCEFELLEALVLTMTQWAAFLCNVGRYVTFVPPGQDHCHRVAIKQWSPIEPREHARRDSEPMPLHAADAFHETFTMSREKTPSLTHRLLFGELGAPIDLVASPRWGVRLQFDAAPGQEPPRVAVLNDAERTLVEWERPTHSMQYSTVGTVQWGADACVKLRFELGQGCDYTVTIERLQVRNNGD